MDADVFRSKKLSSAQRWRAVVEVILTDMGAHDNTLDERGCSLYLYVNTIVGEVMGMIITEQVRTCVECRISREVSASACHHISKLVSFCLRCTKMIFISFVPRKCVC